MLSFVRQLLKDRRNTGAVLPSSNILAKTMTRAIARREGPKRVLEVGPGTGPFTRAILRSLRDGDEFHIVEISPIFCRRLEEKVLRKFRREHPQIRVQLHCAPIELAKLEDGFDFIVCGLPFNNFTPQTVRSIFRRLIRLLADGGELTYFEYAGVRAIKGSISNEAGRRRLWRIGATNRILKRRHGGHRELVLGNVPPAIAVRLTR
jgi:phosphatidylethanolamine/phosphatidyl-N-methylethanolamine N-methyltransferase